MTQHSSNLKTTVIAPTKFKGVNKIRVIFWLVFFLVFLAVFSLTKIPDTRVRALIMTEINNSLSGTGAHFTTQESWLSFGYGFTYKMRDSKLSFPAEGAQPISEVQFEKIEVAPQLLKLLFGKMGGTLWFKSSAGKTSLSFSGSKFTTTPEVDVGMSVSHLDVLKLGIIKLLTNKTQADPNSLGSVDPSAILRELNGSIVLDGSLNISGSTVDLNTFSGDIDLDIENFKLDGFSIMGFQIPKLKASQGQIQISVNSGKGRVKKIVLGKSVKDGMDDLVVEASGDFNLGKNLSSSGLKLQLKLQLSKAVRSQMSLLEIALKSAITPEGAYVYQVVGPMLSPQFTAGLK